MQMDEIRNQGNPGDPLSAETAYLQRTARERKVSAQEQVPDTAGLSFAKHVMLHYAIDGERTIRELASVSDDGRVVLHFIRAFEALRLTEQEARYFAEWLIESADTIKRANAPNSEIELRHKA